MPAHGNVLRLLATSKTLFTAVFNIFQLFAYSLFPSFPLHFELLIFWPAFWVTFFALQIFNVFDLLVLDWLIFVTWQPRFLILPGTEGMAGYQNYAFHAKGFLAGTLLWLIVASVSAVVL